MSEASPIRDGGRIGLPGVAGWLRGSLVECSESDHVGDSGAVAPN